MQLWTDCSYNSKNKQAGLGIVIRRMIPHGLEERRVTLTVKAVDNNQGELKAIYHGLQYIQGIPQDEPIFIITDSKIAIDAINGVNTKKEEYLELAQRIRGMLCQSKWRIYHKKAHTNNRDIYSKRQALTDYLAKQANHLDR